MSELPPCYLAFDLGATSWRAAIGYSAGADLCVEEIQREEHVPIEHDGGLFWDADGIFNGMRGVLREIGRRGVELSAIGIDSWSVDYVLLDADGRPLEAPRCYRDPRHDGMLARLTADIPLQDLFDRTGVLCEDITTLCQLLAARESAPGLLAEAARLLFMPGLFRFWLCGEHTTDFTMAATSQLYSIFAGCWDAELLSRLGLPAEILPPVCRGPTVVGFLRPEIQADVGLGRVPIVAGASHDTAAAFATAPRGEDSAILSSGTWSVLGVHIDGPLPSGAFDPRRFGYEGNVDGSLRLVHNVPGMWLLEQCRRAWKRQGIGLSHQELIASARECAFLESSVDPFWPGFTHPESMPEAVAAYCRETGQREPRTPGETTRSILLGLANSYAEAIQELGELTGRRIERLVVVGGGAQNSLLNECTAKAAGVAVITGCVEATTLGNIGTQQQALSMWNGVD